MEEINTRLRLAALQDNYISAIDNDKLEEWAAFFTEDGFYEIVSKENVEQGLPAPIIHCDSARMIRDRVLSLRNANIYERPSYRHFLSGMQWQPCEDGWTMTTNYLVVNTVQDGSTSIYQAGRYIDHVVNTPDGLRFRKKRCVFDTSRVQTLLAYPI
ncbi:anthranilate 1,2-dioxygenase small subunit AndAd [Paraburkholderia phymatum]|uniref:anthranilate 1,2-dioxygenase small subunit AndAd n=1 Tax=Paraburkholderia phymatum TaxID=148447 RepID=UPI00317FF326